MGIVRKALGEENLPVKEELKAIKQKEEENITTKDLIPEGVEMFVRLKDYVEVVKQLQRLERIVRKLEELERMHAEMQELHEKFLDQLESALGEVEDIKEKMHMTLGVKKY